MIFTNENFFKILRNKIVILNQIYIYKISNKTFPIFDEVQNSTFLWFSETKLTVKKKANKKSNAIGKALKKFLKCSIITTLLPPLKRGMLELLFNFHFYLLFVCAWLRIHPTIHTNGCSQKLL